jgi:L-methionine (R)-S-oxide reductase
MHDPQRNTPWTASAPAEKAALYRALRAEIEVLLAGEPDPVANAANAAAAIFHSLPDLNWAGFYFLRGQTLVLGPFQGKPACVRIESGRGVCGTVVAGRRSVLVPDVAAFPGHIACDTASQSELAVPLLSGDSVVGVLDLDSPRSKRFDATDRDGCEELAAMLVSYLLPR